MLLFEGLSSAQGQRLEALQLRLLRRRTAFSAPDFEFLAQRCLQLSQAAQLPHQAFQERLKDQEQSLPPPEPGLHPGGWFLAQEEERLWGLRLDLEAQLLSLSERMKVQGLSDPKAQLRLRSLNPLSLSLDSPIWVQEAQAAQAAYGGKRLLLIFSLLSLLLLSLFGLLSWRRERSLLSLKAEFVATVSHELRTPLASLQLMAETLERRLKGLPKARDYPSRMLRELEGLSFLVENILSFNRLESGRWRLQIRPLRLENLLRQAEERLRAQSPLELLWEQGGEAHLKGDPELLLLLLLNLGRNACQYVQRRPLQIWVQILEGPRLRFRDNGPGIPPALRPKLFQAFHRGETGRGSGLGLAICRRIMELHGGSIQLMESGPEGSCFELRFRKGGGG